MFSVFHAIKMPKKNEGGLRKKMEFAPLVGGRLKIGNYALLAVSGNYSGRLQVCDDILSIAGRFIEELNNSCQLINKSQ